MMTAVYICDTQDGYIEGTPGFIDVADGIERTLWKNTVTGELRVKRFVRRRRDNGKALAAYFPA